MILNEIGEMWSHNKKKIGHASTRVIKERSGYARRIIVDYREKRDGGEAMTMGLGFFPDYQDRIRCLG